ncbi:hypothetical protein DNTS_027871 [Danionella cerebrum]|uniref:THD domain-containing protein n=1 Tax=Danionella cerebrum TaxID=2873325 RepID=A0A553MQM6_9TELE|nr:hypothetical protein DNTS_027871 [Danionella translucida]
MDHQMKACIRALKIKVIFSQVLCALFCVSCCIYTLQSQGNLSVRKEIEDRPKADMQQKDPNHKMQTFVRLTVPKKSKLKYGDVEWIPTPESVHPNNTGYLSLSVNGSHLEVLRTGIYRICLQITYKHITEAEQNVSLQQDVYITSDKYENEILQLTSMEAVNFDYWRKSLFTEGIFELDAGDKLFIRANLSFIDVYTNYRQKNFLVVSKNMY